MLAPQQIAIVCDVTFQIAAVAGDADFIIATERTQKWPGFFNPPDTGADSGTGVVANNGFGRDDTAGGGPEQGGWSQQRHRQWRLPLDQCGGRGRLRPVISMAAGCYAPPHA